MLLWESLIDSSFDAALILDEGTAVNAGLLAAVDGIIKSTSLDWDLLALDCPAHCTSGQPHPAGWKAATAGVCIAHFSLWG